jgi:hypothetical protein
MVNQHYLKDVVHRLATAPIQIEMAMAIVRWFIHLCLTTQRKPDGMVITDFTVCSVVTRRGMVSKVLFRKGVLYERSKNNCVCYTGKK